MNAYVRAFGFCVAFGALLFLVALAVIDGLNG